VRDTIYALSSGNPPAAIAIVRISGPDAGEALKALAGRLPRPRYASFSMLREPGSGDLLDRAIMLWFPGPESATGEDLAELHLHGGRSVVAACLSILEKMSGLRAAEPGEFTRRAFENGRIDLAEAEGLADLLMAETQSQRRAALRLAGGALSRMVAEWQRILLGLSAQVEANLDFSDEGDVAESALVEWKQALVGLITDIEAMLLRPPAERLREGVRIVIAGPPNVGKSSLLNYLAGREAAITSALAGTTRDLVEAPVAIGGAPFLLIDTAGLRESDDEIEGIGIDRARESLATADLILWLGAPQDCPDPARAILVETKCDLRSEMATLPGVDISISSKTGEGIDRLIALLVERSATLLPGETEIALNARHRIIIAECLDYLREAAGAGSYDLLITAEALRQARSLLDRITGRAGVEDMLDALFGTFCIGK
jgi:tRNA modification GTPase